MAKKKNKRVVIIFSVIFLIGLIAGLFYFGILQTIYPDTIWVYDQGRLECNEDFVHESIQKWVDQNYEFECGGDSLVDECRIYGECGDTSFPFYNCDGGYRINNGNWIFYELQKGERNLITTISPGQIITFAQRSVTTNIGIIIPANKDKTEINYEYNKYRLYTIEGGGKFISSSSDCCLANQNQLQRNQFEYGDWDCLGKGEFRNYFLDWEQVSGAKIYNYGGNDVICRYQGLYKLDEEKLSDDSIRKIQGEKIKNVECCPHQDDNCDSSNFEFIQTGQEEEIECVYNYQCANTGNPYDDPFSQETAKIQKCIEGKCIESTIEIECDSDSKCRELYGEGYGCDLSYDNYGNCIKIGSIEQLKCGDGYCTTGESKINCPADCGEYIETCIPIWETKKQICGLGCQVGLSEPTEECKPSGIFYGVLIGVFLLVGFIIFIVFKIIQKRLLHEKKK